MVQVQRSDLANGSGTRTGLPSPLVGGMPLDSVEMPVCALGRQQGTSPVLSYPMARGCSKLLNGEVGSVDLMGSASDTSPSTIQVVLANGTSRAWITLEGFAPDKTLKLCGMPFSSQLLNYNFGLMVGLFLLLNRDVYTDFTCSLQKAIDARQGQNDLLKVQTLAQMADELTLAVEQMIDGCDPLGISYVLMDREMPANLEQSFDGGDLLKQSFVDLDALKQSVGTTSSSSIRAKWTGTKSFTSSFLGDLSPKLTDCILRGKHMLLTGPTATGKTLCVEEACLRLGAPLTTIRGSEGLEDRDLVGATTITTETTQEGNIASKTVFTYGPLPEAMMLAQKQYDLQCQENERAKQENREPVRIPPSVLLIDEINRLQLRHQNFLVTMLNVRKATQDYYLRIPDTNEEVACPDKFLVVIAARNIGAAFTGTNLMDLALERRFYKKINVDYLPPESESTLIQTRTGLDSKLAQVLVKVTQDTRHQLSQLKAPLDTGTLLAWAEEIAWLSSGGTHITDQVLLDTARDLVFDIVLERTERGNFDPVGEAVLADNISENWRDIIQTQ